MPVSPARRCWLAAGLIVVGVLLIYLPVAGFGFFQEDGVELPGFPFDSLRDLLLNPLPGGLYYRPLIRLILTVLRRPDGTFWPTPYHLYQLTLHALNAGLVCLLAERVWRPADADRALWAGVASAGLWAVYPWVYDGLARNSTPQPTATFLALIAVLAYLRYRDARRPGWLALAGMASVLAPADHESGLVVGAAILASEAWAWLSARDRFRWEALALLGLNLAYGVWWFTRTSASIGNIERLDERWAYFLQAIAYPGVALAYGVLPGLPLAALAIGVALSLPVVILAIRADWRAVAYSLAWFALFIAPTTLSLSYHYITRAPRMLYASGIGVAMIWGGGALIGARDWRWRRALIGVPVAVFAFSLVLVSRNHRMYAAATTATNALLDLGASQAPGARLLVLDFPETYAHRRFTFPYGWEGVGVATAAARLEEFVALPGGPPIETHDYTALPYTHAADDFPYVVTTRGPVISLDELLDWAAWADETYRTLYLPDGRTVYLPVGAIGPTPDAEPLAHFGEGLSLFAASAETTPNGLRIETVWGVEAGLEPNVTLFLHLRAGDEVVSQADGDLLAGLLPPVAVPPGVTVRDVRYTAVPASATIETVAVGAYNWVNGERLPATDAQGRPLPDDAYTFDLSR
jgi:hypothetical protein